MAREVKTCLKANSFPENLYQLYETSLVWVKIQENSKDIRLILPTENSIQNYYNYEDYYSYEDTERYQNFSRHAVLFEEGYKVKRILDLGGNTDIFLKHKGNFLDLYKRIFGAKMHETYGMILQIAERIPQKDNSGFWSNPSEPEPELGIVVWHYVIDGSIVEFSSDFFAQSWITEKNLMLYEKRNALGFFDEH